MAAAAQADWEELQIDAGGELRFETEKVTVRVTCRLQQGDASCFGTPLQQGRVYTFPEGSKAALFSARGAAVQLKGHAAARRAASGSAAYAGLLQRLRGMRDAARAGQGDAPRVLVVGPTDSGKSTLCKHLINDATTSRSAVAFIDCDLGQNSITCPGSIAAVFLDEGQTVDVEEGLSLLQPLAFYFGDLSVNKDNINYYHHLCCQLYACLKANQENRSNFAPGGFIVNTMGWTQSFGYQALTHIASALQINTVICMNDQQLGVQLRGDLGGGCTVVDIARPDGVVVRHQSFRRQQRDLRLREFFCGVKTVLKPARCVVPFDKVQLFRIGAAQETWAHEYLPAHLAPQGPQDPGPQHQLCVAAVSHGGQPEELPHANAAGFVCIIAVDTAARELTLLAPCDDALPSPYLIVGSQKMAYEDTLV